MISTAGSIRSSSMPWMTMFAPSRASHSAVVCPRPFVLPVTSAHLPANRPSDAVVPINRPSYQRIQNHQCRPEGARKNTEDTKRGNTHSPWCSWCSWCLRGSSLPKSSEHPEALYDLFIDLDAQPRPGGHGDVAVHHLQARRTDIVQQRRGGDVVLQVARV